MVIIALSKGIEDDLMRLFVCLQVLTSKIIVKKHEIASCYKLKLTSLIEWRHQAGHFWGDGKDSTPGPASAGTEGPCSLRGEGQELLSVVRQQ